MDTEISSTSKERPKPANWTHLKRCFQTLVDRKQLNLDTVVLELMLKNEVLIDLDKLDKVLAVVLPHMLVFYMKNWPGWQKSPEYYSGKLSFKDWFLKFRQYLSVKLNYLIKNGYSEIMNQEDEAEVNSTEDIVPPTEMAPFVINIQGAPKYLSTLVFDVKNNDITIHRHLEPEWKGISLREFVNWPYVGMEFRSSEFAFKRFNRNECRRWLNLTSCSMSIGAVKFIEEARIINKETSRSVHSLERIYAYSKQFIEVLNSNNLKDKIDANTLELIEVLLEEFLKDIKEIGINNTFATNTVVVFNIGQQAYIRNKKLENKQANPNKQVGLCEVLIPKMEIQMNYFSALEDTTTAHTSFCHLNEVNRLVTDNVPCCTTFIPKLIYKCLFCNVQFDMPPSLLSHFQQLHGMEPPFSCNNCNKSFTIPELARSRWCHECKK
ncbi:uncharacterized protein LOC114327372 [Diabrotica virgifera virgifera]|uniref:Uncharacterized protein LOC114327372 n=1 Tax=Diabrotica virgifera virgifera TaxID=50390 RepID=A0A6P7FEI7_DIAVI|nr:uncharacterized protein LOC114327372 [Diabrotica virgifera virgifera]